MNEVQIQGLGKINKDRVNFEYMITGYVKNVKPVITKRIKQIINQFEPKKVKSGKTNNPNKRRQGKDYHDYTDMFILYTTDSQESVSHIETYYNKYIKQHYPEIAQNIRQGSAGRIGKNTKKHTFYMVIC